MKQLTLLLCLLSASVAVGAAPVLLHSEHNIEAYQLKNGMRIILADNPKETRIYMNTIYLTGSLNDPQGKGGLAHLLEHLAFKGTQDVKEKEFQRRLDQYTLSHNASTSYYSTQYSQVIRAEKKALEALLYLEAQRMDKLVLKAQFIPTEIDIVKREREIRLDQPMSVLMDQVVKSAYGNQHLGRLPIGDLTELQSIGLEELQQYYRDWYTPNNVVMVLTGKLNKSEILKQIEKNFAAIASRKLPERAPVVTFDIRKMQNRHFNIAKGSDYADINFYMQSKPDAFKAEFSFAPYLYSMEPTGRLYTQMVETGVANGVITLDASDQERNMMVMGAVFSPKHNENQVKEQLLQQVEESPAQFTESELQRIKAIQKNGIENALKNSATMLGILSHYIVARDGQWQAFFSDQEAVKNTNVNSVNAALNQLFKPENRVSARLTPMPDDQKQVQKMAQVEDIASHETIEEIVEPLKDVKTYQQEMKRYVKASQEKLQATERKIQRGQLSNGMKYALFPTSTRDEKTYATISIGFGDADRLFDRAEMIGLTTYLMLRGSEKYTRQQLLDQSIAVGGSAQVSSSVNHFNIQISAKKEHFAEYFRFIVDNLKQPKFEQKEFDLIRGQTLALLDRPYTEPDIVVGFKLANILEQYQQGDLRYHFDPVWSKKQLSQATNEQVKNLYARFFNMQHAYVAVTGEFDAATMSQTLAQELGKWTGQEEYAQILPKYKQYTAQKIHVFAEPREFGAYQAVLTLPINSNHTDASALLVLNHILGGSQLSSRLAQELREKKGLVYGFSSNLNMDHTVESGSLNFSANYSAGKSADVSTAIHKVLTDLLQYGVTEQELAEAKASILKRRVTNLDDERSIHRMLISQLKWDENMKNRMQRDQEYSQLKTQDILAVIRKYIKPEQLIEVMADQYAVMK